ncbi:hypothetical protein PO124_25875 [Bacillus licheniformis]|nr:hypothetical protein [Bacillus licheniformis]
MHRRGLAKADPVWPDPVPFLQTAATGDFASSGRSKVGYGTNDEALGGPFQRRYMGIYMAGK